MNPEGIKKRETWSSFLSFVWVTAGAAIGLGNVWKFPYMAGSYGGSAFVLLYLFFVLVIAIPVMAAEIMLGKLSKRNAVDGFVYLAALHGRSSWWRLTGYLGAITLQLVFCFYSVVAGFSVAYIFFGATDSFHQRSPSEITTIWTSFLAEPLLVLLCTALFIFFTMAIVYLGIKKGIEKACTMMMPGLLVVLLVLVIFSASSGGFSQAVSFLFAFEPQKIEANVVISALGHAFFTLAVGACAMMVYGSYLPSSTSVAKSVFIVAILDVLVALLSGLAIFPLIFEGNLSPSQGPGLMFVSLPMVFSTIPFGWLFGTLFFVLLFFAALSSSLSFAEPLVDLLIEKLLLSRKNAVFIIGGVTFLGSVFCALSFNVFAKSLLFGRWTFFDFIADLSTNFLLPLGGIAISVFAGLVVKQADFFAKKTRNSAITFHLWRFLTLFVAPLAIFIVLCNSVIDLFA